MNQYGRIGTRRSRREARRANLNMDATTVIANGREVKAQLPCSIEEFLTAQDLLPRSVVVEHNGEAVAPSEFSKRQLNAGDRLEIVKIVAGG
jgi:thiamine biosynthesis protein ThiS